MAENGRTDHPLPWLARAGAAWVCQALGLMVALGSPDTNGATVAPAAGTTLLRLEAAPDPGAFILRGDGPLPFQKRWTTDPPRVILDLPGVASRLEAEPLPPAGGPVTAIHVDAYGEGAERGTRLVFDLRAPYTPTVEATGDGLSLQLDARGTQGPGEEPEVVVEAFPRLAAEDRIGAEDLLEIEIFELPELQSTVRVKVDGTISLPLLGALPVAGMTVASLEGRLRDILQERYVTNPHVRVLVKEHESRKVSLIGAVAKPGSYVLRGERTMLQMILEAGGLGRDAGTQVVVLRNAGDPREERVRVDLQKLMTQADPSANLRLQPGDIVNVLPDEPVYIYVDGAVKSPGQIETRASRRLTLLQAIIRAGGTTDVANPRQVRVLRKTTGESRQTLIFNTKKIRAGKAEDIYLQDGDIVVIPEALF